MTSMATGSSSRQHRAQARPDRVVYAGVDTHKDVHVAAVIDAGETVLGTRSFSTTRAGYRALLAWVGEFGQLARVGVEGTGSYGAELRPVNPCPGSKSMAPSSPASRPSPPGGLRPALTPGCGQHPTTPVRAGQKEHQQVKIPLTKVSTESGDR
jgi:Transposase